MPSLQCAVSPDGKHVAVRRGAALALHAAEGGAVLAETSLVSEDSTLVFAGGALVEHAIDATGRTLLTGYSLAKLARVASCEIPMETQLAADTGKFLLLAFGDSAHVVNVQPTVISYGEMRAAGKVRWAIGAEQDELMVSSSRGIEMWDAASRRPVRRVHVQLPDAPPAIGPSAQRRTLWHTMPNVAEVRTVRLSDGKAGLIRLPSVPIGAIGHPASSWLVADLDGRPHAINLVTVELQALPTPPAASRALIPRGTAAILVQLDLAGTLEWWELGATQVEGPRGLTIAVGGAAAPVDVKPEPPPPPPVVIAEPTPPPPSPPAPPPAPADAPVPAVTLAPEAAARGVLRPDVVLALDGGPRGDEPAAIGLHVDREVARVLDAVAQRIRAAWLDRVVDDSLAGRVSSPEAMQRALLAEARHGVVLEGAGIVEIDASGRITPRRRLLADRPVSPWTTLRVSLDRARPTPLRTGARVLELALPGAALREIGVLLGMLVAGAGPGVIASYTAEARWAGRIAGVLAALDLLAPAPARPTLTGQLAPGTIAALGGHTLLANLGGAHVLVDPRLPAASAADAVPVPTASDLPILAATLLTSDDPAALDPSTLLTLDKRAPIYLPASPDPAQPVPRAVALLHELGFGDVRLARPDDELELGGGGRVIVGPGVEPPPRHVTRCVYALCHGHACTLATGALVIDDQTIAILAAIAHDLATRVGPVSPVFVDVPRRPSAPIERGWLWLFDPVERWLAPRPRRPADLAAISRVGRGGALVIYGDHERTPAGAGAQARRAEPYDRYRIGGDQDGWLAPRGGAA